MRVERILICGLTIALFVMSYKIGVLSKGEEIGTSESIDKREVTLSVIQERKSVRKFTSEPVSRKDIETLMRAGMAAPSGMDKRPWQFIAITDKSIMQKIRKFQPYAGGLDTSPAAIVVCGDLKKSSPNVPEFWITDTCAATQNILLAAESMGLGAVWCGLYPQKERMEKTREVLDLPEYIMPLCVIPIGHPDGTQYPKDKFDPSTIHWEKW